MKTPLTRVVPTISIVIFAAAMQVATAPPVYPRSAHRWRGLGQMSLEPRHRVRHHLAIADRGRGTAAVKPARMKREPATAALAASRTAERAAVDLFDRL